MGDGLEYLDRLFKQQDRLQKQQERIQASKERHQKERVVGEYNKGRFEEPVDRITKQRKLERKRSLEAEKRAQARVPDKSGKWARRRAKWNKKERKFWE